MSGILILGAGGHAKVIVDILTRQALFIAGYLDDNPAAWGATQLDIPILGPIESYADYRPDGMIVGIGRNETRQAIIERLGPAVDDLWCNAIHPDATIADSARIGRGVVIVARAIVNPDTVIGDHVIINTRASVGHDCQVGDFVHIGPGCTLTGGTVVGAGTFLGAGTIVIPCHSIGEWSVTGAGSVVVNDIPPSVTVKGVPAR